MGDSGRNRIKVYHFKFVLRYSIILGNIQPKAKVAATATINRGGKRVANDDSHALFKNKMKNTPNRAISI
jgi:hypothetical protein